MSHNQVAFLLSSCRRPREAAHGPGPAQGLRHRLCGLPTGRSGGSAPTAPAGRCRHQAGASALCRPVRHTPQPTTHPAIIIFYFCKLIAFLIWFSCLYVGQRDCWTGLPTIRTDRLQRQTLCRGTCTGRWCRRCGGPDSSCSLRTRLSTSGPPPARSLVPSTCAGPVSPEQEGAAGARGGGPSKGPFEAPMSCSRPRHVL